MDNEQKPTNKYRPTKVLNAGQKVRCSFEKLALALIRLIRWWVSHRQPGEVAVMLRLVEIVGLVLVVLILSAVGKIDEIAKIVNCLNVRP
jgi:hypothetical protein